MGAVGLPRDPTSPENPVPRPPGLREDQRRRGDRRRAGLAYSWWIDAVVSSFLGETASNLHRIFDFARNGSWVLLFDEFDALGKALDDPSEHGEIKRVITAFLQMVDSFRGPSLLIAATNHEQLLDPALWRRFDEISSSRGRPFTRPAPSCDSGCVTPAIMGCRSTKPPADSRGCRMRRSKRSHGTLAATPCWPAMTVSATRTSSALPPTPATVPGRRCPSTCCCQSGSRWAAAAGRRRRPGTPPRNPHRHGDELKRQLGRALDRLRPIRVVEGVDPARVFKIRARGRIVDQTWAPRIFSFSERPPTGPTLSSPSRNSPTA